MKNILGVVALAALVAGCGEPNDSDSGTAPSPDPAPDPGTDPVGLVDGVTVVGDVTSTSFNSTNGTLTVQVTLDGDDVMQAYTAAGDLDGYSRFTQQDDPLDRAFTAFAREADDGSIKAVIAMDGGQFNRYFAGGTIDQDSYTAPTSGLTSYAGAYVGLSNVGTGQPIPVGADPSLTPEAATEITGTVFMNADFTDNSVNGAIYDRVFDPNGQAIDLQTVVMTVTSIGADGSFNGSVEFQDLTGVGTYTGAFGGDDAANVAGIVSLGEGFLDGATDGGAVTTQFDGIVGEAEVGVFVLGQCPAGGADCFGTE